MSFTSYESFEDEITYWAYAEPAEDGKQHSNVERIAPYLYGESEFISRYLAEKRESDTFAFMNMIHCLRFTDDYGMDLDVSSHLIIPYLQDQDVDIRKTAWQIMEQFMPDLINTILTNKHTAGHWSTFQKILESLKILISTEADAQILSILNQILREIPGWERTIKDFAADHPNLKVNYRPYRTL